MTRQTHSHEQGGISGSLIAIISLIVLVLAAGSAAVWAYINYTDQKNNVDSKISLAVAKAEKEQADSDAAKFAQREKEPNRQFVGPDDYGRLTFNYPKTWSTYIASDVTQSGGTYQAYLNPVTVPPINGAQQRFALRVAINQQEYSTALTQYGGLVTSGKLSSSVVDSNGKTGTRFDGTFSDGIRGAAVVFKVRDKTITLRTDADTFKPDFDALIKTIDFND